MRKADRDREAREKRDKTTGGSIQAGQPMPKLAAVVPSAKSMSIKSMQKAQSCAGSSLKGGAQRVQASGPAPPQGSSATSTPSNLSCKFDQLPSVITWLLQDFSANELAAFNNEPHAFNGSEDNELQAFLDVQVEEAEAEAEKFADKPVLLIADKPVLFNGVWYKSDRAKVIGEEEELERKKLLDDHSFNIQKAKQKEDDDRRRAELRLASALEKKQSLRSKQSTQESISVTEATSLSRRTTPVKRSLFNAYDQACGGTQGQPQVVHPSQKKATTISLCIVLCLCSACSVCLALSAIAASMLAVTPRVLPLIS